MALERLEEPEYLTREIPIEIGIFDMTPVVDHFYQLKLPGLDLHQLVSQLGRDKFDSPQELLAELQKLDPGDTNINPLTTFLTGFIAGEDSGLEKIASPIGCALGGNGYNVADAIGRENETRFAPEQQIPVTLNNQPIEGVKSLLAKNIVFVDRQTKLVVRDPNRHSPSLSALNQLINRLTEVGKPTVLHLADFPGELKEPMSDQDQNRFSEFFLSLLQEYKEQGGAIYLQYCRAMQNLNSAQLSRLISMAEFIVLNKEECWQILEILPRPQTNREKVVYFEESDQPIMFWPNIQALPKAFGQESSFQVLVTDGPNPIYRIFKKLSSLVIKVASFSPKPFPREYINVTGAGDTFTGIFLLLVSTGCEPQEAVKIATERTGEIIAAKYSSLALNLI